MLAILFQEKTKKKGSFSQKMPKKCQHNRGRHNAAPKEAKVKSLKEAMVIQKEVTEYLTSENLQETANDLSKNLSNIQSIWLSSKLKASVQSKVTVSNESVVLSVSITILKKIFLGETMINDRFFRTNLFESRSGLNFLCQALISFN